MRTVEHTLYKMRFTGCIIRKRECAFSVKTSNFEKSNFLKRIFTAKIKEKKKSKKTDYLTGAGKFIKKNFSTSIFVMQLIIYRLYSIVVTKNFSKILVKNLNFLEKCQKNRKKTVRKFRENSGKFRENFPEIPGNFLPGFSRGTPLYSL